MRTISFKTLRSCKDFLIGKSQLYLSLGVFRYTIYSGSQTYSSIFLPVASASSVPFIFTSSFFSSFSLWLFSMEYCQFQYEGDVSDNGRHGDGSQDSCDPQTFLSRNTSSVQRRDRWSQILSDASLRRSTPTLRCPHRPYVRHCP